MKRVIKIRNIYPPRVFLIFSIPHPINYRAYMCRGNRVTRALVGQAIEDLRMSQKILIKKKVLIIIGI